jgi:hypothetical protein
MSEAIYFPLIPARRLLPSGDTDFRGLCVLFTLDETARLERVDDEFFRYRYQTDKAGLEQAAHLGRCAASALANAIEVIGKLTVHADLAELDAGDHAALGWLVSGLGELTFQVLDATFAAGKALADGDYLEPGDANAETK